MQVVLTDVTKSFNETKILRNVSLHLHKGEMYSLIGASGAGKTTLLRLIAGLEEPTLGVIDTDGARISYAFQEPRLFPQLTVRDNILAISPMCPLEEILRELDLTDAGDKYPHELSGGMRKRVAVARAISAEADVYLLDEPTGGQDAGHAAMVANAILCYTAGALTVVATHDETLLRTLGKKTIKITNNKCVLLP